MNVDDALARVERIDDLHWATAAELVLAAEVRRLREEVAKLDELTDRQSEHVSDLAHEVDRLQAREAKARELAELAYRALRSRLPMPNCRDCADENGFCPNNPGMPCDSAQATEWAIEIRNRLARWLEG